MFNPPHIGRRIKITLSFFLLLQFSFFVAQQNLSQLVNPFIGTGGHGHTFPGAVAPFGMVQLSPDTRIDGSWDGCGGYHYSDSIIYGFSHTHLSGTGVSDYGDILLMPMLGEPSMDSKVYSSKFKHLKEKAHAGFYEVQLEDDNIKAELTTTLRTGIHRYTFPKGSKANLILDLMHRDKTLNCNLRVLDSVTVSGYRVSEAWAKEQHVYFIMRFSKPIKKLAYAVGKTFRDTLNKKINEQAQGAYFQFDISDDKPLIVKVALSPVNTDGAMLNMDVEAIDWDFEKYKSNAEQLWNKELSKIEVQSDDKDKLTIFYTALYHCMIHPSINMDVDHKYRGRDNKIHTTPGFTYYSVFSLWDTFRALHPLFTILDHKRVVDFINTFIYQYADSKRLPMWELSGNETDCMIGYHAASVIVDAFEKGIGGFDTLVAYDAMKAAANYSLQGIPAYIKNGYLQVDDEPESVSKTLEYAYDDWCIAQLAQKLNKPDDYKYYIRRAQSYKNLFDPSTGFMRPRKNGNWLSPFDPKEVNNHFTEANSWQYSFFVPHDLDGLMALHGGSKNFEHKLDELFTTTSKTTGREQSDITGLIGQYAHGNEPSHHMAYLYNYVGKPQKTIDRVRQILNDFYKNKPDGLIGNEDCGQMSAWYVFSSLGFYPVCPGTNDYVLGASNFNHIKLNLEDGRSFFINTISEGGNEFIKGVVINAKPTLRSTISQHQIFTGGGLTFYMTNKKDTTNKYGNGQLQKPHSRIHANQIVTVPVIVSQSKSFKEKQEIIINAGNNKTANIVYTTDGTEPTKRSAAYGQAFNIDATCIIKAKIYTEKDSSKTTSSYFYKMPHNWSIDIKSKYNAQYSAGGAEGIIDGVNGDVNWRKGEWQGYQGQNFECTVNLGALQIVKSLSSNYLQDTRAWIVFPKEVEYFISKDGKKFTSVGKISNTVKAEDYEVQLKSFELILSKETKAHYIKVVAKNFGKLPDWHLGKDGDAFIFIDELDIK